ncbi:hypothetical protein [Rhodobacter ferrooxidans]|uniref:Uncharacterized protein n=1 Tax=Rhodobacter ferrooxidans TaxID=371731 RepID=C8RY19_9RHOB|nr:hypothetical protein [Rhodobacter sp. SW2]EEW26417.1 hypothetical protein Rsw2DRAFT_0697 [Rhodobacter sp. SW2]
MRLSVLLLAMLPTFALAEDGVVTLDCRVVTACDADGKCTPQDRPASFRLQRQAGSDVLLVYDAVSAPVTSGGDDNGPLSWSEGRGDSQTMLATGYSDDDRVNMVWHSSNSGTDDTPGQTRFLSCVDPE